MDIHRKNMIFLACIFIFLGFMFFKPWIIGDGINQYVYLRSAVIDKDLNFTDEYNYFRTQNIGGSLEIPKQGLPKNMYSIGPAILWSPFFMMAHIIEKIRGNPLTGYSRTYLLFTTLGTLFYSLIGLILIYFFLIEFVKPNLAFYSTIIIFTSTNLIYYTFNDPSMSHALSMFCVSLFFYHWVKTLKNTNISDEIIRGLIFGIMVLSRWQNAVFGIILLAGMKKSNLKEFILKKLPFAITFFLVFLPQMIVWKILYGSYLTIPQGNSFIIWWPKFLPQVLFSPIHGLLIWTPIILFAFIGLNRFIESKNKLAWIIIISLLVQLYINSSVVDWHGSWSYGSRRFADCSVIFSLGIAYFLKELKMNKLRVYAYYFLSGLILWNLLLLSQVHFNHLMIDPAYPFLELIKNQFLIAPRLLLRLILKS